MTAIYGKQPLLRTMTYGLILLLGVTVPSSGQILGTGVIPTIEVSPMQQNSLVTSLQTTISAVQSVIQSGYALLDLTPLDDLALSGEFIQTMALLGELAAEGQMLMQDVEAAAADFEVLFSVEVLPSTPHDLQVKYNETTAMIWRARRYAVCAQSLISNITGAVAHVTRIVDLMRVLVGNMQGQQLQVQLLAQANQTLATQTLQQAADQRVRILEGAQRDIMVRGWNKMQAERWAGWPTSAEGGD